jgi:hypothetical protein
VRPYQKITSKKTYGVAEVIEYLLLLSKCKALSSKPSPTKKKKKKKTLIGARSIVTNEWKQAKGLMLLDWLLLGRGCCILIME